LDHVEAIAAVDGIDVLWVGHFDLSNFMGMPAQFDDPTFVAAMQHAGTSLETTTTKSLASWPPMPLWVDRVKAMGYTHDCRRHRHRHAAARFCIS
jgi:2-dehydro-3-deoxyglucarate aldolase/4-hydroxy-2-oxoheptanedioate aldolase